MFQKVEQVELSRHSTSRSSRVVLTTLVIVATTVLLVGGALLLPHDRYLRFKTSTDSEYAKFGWIYERIHFDRRPIDIAFFGDSRIMLGVDSTLVEQSFTNASGQAVNVVNFGLIGGARGTDYLMARELLQTARPRVLVVGVNETETGQLDNAFELLAERSDLFDAALRVDPRYLTGLLHLPARQLSLFARTIVPEFFGDNREFNWANYRGPHWDNPELEFAVHGLFHPNVYEETSPESELKAHQRKMAATAVWTPNPHLPLIIQAELRRLKNRASLRFLQDLLELAKQKDVPVRFLYAPVWRHHAVPEQADFYRSYGPTWSYPGDMDRNEWWYDSTHLNRGGSIVFSDWLGRRLAEEFQDEGPGSPR
jgi:hypothetical protein